MLVFFNFMFRNTLFFEQKKKKQQKKHSVFFFSFRRNVYKHTFFFERMFINTLKMLRYKIRFRFHQLFKIYFPSFKKKSIQNLLGRLCLLQHGCIDSLLPYPFLVYIKWHIVPVSISQLAETCIVICMDCGSNSEHPTYSF